MIYNTDKKLDLTHAVFWKIIKEYGDKEISIHSTYKLDYF